MARSNVRVRPARLDDVAALAALVQSAGRTPAAGPRSPGSTTEELVGRLSRVLEDEERSLLVACDEADEVLGALLVRSDQIGAFDLSPVLHITHLVVAQRHRRRGIGRALLAATVRLADHDGVEHVVASVAAHSREGNRYLARIGFAPLQVQRIASTAALRRSLGLPDVSGRVAVLRRSRLVRAQRAGLSARGA